MNDIQSFSYLVASCLIAISFGFIVNSVAYSFFTFGCILLLGVFIDIRLTNTKDTDK